MSTNNLGWLERHVIKWAEDNYPDKKLVRWEFNPEENRITALLMPNLDTIEISFSLNTATGETSEVVLPNQSDA